MSAYTAVPPEALGAFLSAYALGSPQAFQPLADGIENSNYALSTAQGDFVLTLFEQAAAGDLVFPLSLMAGLAGHGLPCPCPLPDRAGRYLGELCGKPALLAPRLPGSSPSQPTPAQCRAVGAALARAQQLGRHWPDLPRHASSGLAWWRSLAETVRPGLDSAAAALLDEELAFQSRQDYGGLPQGLLHADLFRDNVLFDGEALSGLLDWYEAGQGTWLYDLAVAANDWCSLPSGELEPARYAALLEGYAGLRPLLPAERQAWPAMLRAAALRFWLSRLLAWQEAREGYWVQRKEPAEFQRILQARRAGGMA